MSAGLTRIGMRLLPGIEGVIERRVLLGVRVWPEITARFIPKPLFPKIVKGWNIAGVCLIRLGHMRPVGMPGGWDRLPRTQPTGSPSNGWKAGGCVTGSASPVGKRIHRSTNWWAGACFPESIICPILRSGNPPADLESDTTAVLAGVR